MTLSNKISLVIVIGTLGFTIGCTNKNKRNESSSKKTPTLFTLLPSSQTGIDFINKVENQKDFNIFKYRNFYNGGGVAIGDVNNDGLADIYLTGNMVSNKLYLNKGNLTFEDISAKAGVEGSKPWSTGVVMVDINQDGLLDIYVSNAGKIEGNNHDNDLYINNGDLTFTEKAAEYNLANTGFSIHSSFFDYDKDGDLDVYILNNSNIPVSSLGYAGQRDVRAQDWEGVPDIFKGVGDMLLRNDNGKFVDVSEKAGIYGSLIGFGLGVMITDINKDLFPDIYVSNDFYERDYLYINNQDGTFTEDIKGWTSHLSMSAMGIDMADINNDGHAEIFITDMLPEVDERVKSVMEFDGYDLFRLKQDKDFYQQYIQNTLQLNNANGSFSEIAYYSGVDATDWSWAGLLFDMDNDGFRDIFITNGINHDLTDLDFVDFFANEIIQKMALTGRKESIDSIINKMPIRPQPNYAYRNNQDLTFSNANKEWGFELPTLSNGAAYGDLDNDGDLD
ncbi:VCBS repeat-containing protein, partial [uncultured Muriicola sp.]|uniref:FG-GAP repeat domain-containing protein n=1 Tax=uncultured Muriicola sp. TaxID=1583102 RepID=UPI0026336861